MISPIPSSIRDNFKLLLAEVDTQVASLQSYVKNGSWVYAKHILDRIGYVNNLKLHIHNSCLSQMSCGKEGEPETLKLRAIEVITTDLERIAELCRDCAKQIKHLSRWETLEEETYLQMIGRVRTGIGHLEHIIDSKNTQQALKIGRLEEKLDRDYDKLRHTYINRLKQSKKSEDLVTALFVASSIEQMGDALLDISESVISANLGQPVSIERYYALLESVEKLETDEKLQIEPIAETRSGSAISGITSARGKDDGYVAIFKDGLKRKVKEERAGVESWHAIYPGLAPRILSYKKRGQSAALLIEHLAGSTIEQILLYESPRLLNQAIGQLQKTLKSVWRETHTKQRVSASYMGQLKSRLGDVYRVHPEFCGSDSNLCGLGVSSFDSLLVKAKEYEKTLKAPFSVYIHGDFNLDNIIYDPVQDKINFIDLHRSSYMDYVQDISVFMVSSYRLQVLDRPLRRKIMKLARDFCRFARAYAKSMGDKEFELRLALGLARSFATSTRFILDKSLSRAMFLRSRYLIERVLEVDPKKKKDFIIPIEDIFIV